MNTSSTEEHSVPMTGMKFGNKGSQNLGPQSSSGHLAKSDAPWPQSQTIWHWKDRQLWYGFLSTIKSLSQLVGHTGLYPWYKGLSPKMQASLRTHIKRNLPEGSFKQFQKAILNEAFRFRRKFRRAILDKGFILAETRKLDDDTSVVVTIPRSELAQVTQLMFMSGQTNPEIAEILGLSLETVEKLNRDENIAAAMTQDIEGRTVEVLRKRALHHLFSQMRTATKAKTPELIQILKFCDQWEDRERQRVKDSVWVDSEDTQRKRIAHRHQKLLEGTHANPDDEQVGSSGRTQSGS